MKQSSVMAHATQQPLGTITIEGISQRLNIRFFDTQMESEGRQVIPGTCEELAGMFCAGYRDPRVKCLRRDPMDFLSLVTRQQPFPSNLQCPHRHRVRHSESSNR